MSMHMFSIPRQAKVLSRPGRFPACAAAAAILLALFFAPAVSHAAAAPKSGNTRIVSEKMVYDAAKRQVVFDGKVHVTRPDMEIWSDKLVLVMDNPEAPSTPEKENMLGMQGGKVERIIAESNVRIKQEDKLGTCGKATYLVPEGKIIMEQNPVIVDGENRIRGTIINFFTETGRSEVIGNVDVRFSTDDEKGPRLPGGSSDEKAAQ